VPVELPDKEKCKDLMTDLLDAAGISYRLGGWSYGTVWYGLLWPGNAIACFNACEDDGDCVHWTYDCCGTGECRLIGSGGFEEDGDPQFCRDHLFLGDSTHGGYYE